MCQVDYTGLRKRQSYDDMVAIIENDQTKIRYPNRVALEIISSPYITRPAWMRRTSRTGWRSRR